MENWPSHLKRGPNQNNLVLVCRIVLVPMVQNHRNSENVELATILRRYNVCER